MFALPVMAGVGIASGYAMTLPADQSADFQHGGVHEAELRFALKQAIQKYRKLRYYSVAMLEKVLVAWESREIAPVVLANPVIDLADGLLLADEQVKYQDGNDFAVAQRGLTATGGGTYW